MPTPPDEKTKQERALKFLADHPELCSLFSEISAYPVVDWPRVQVTNEDGDTKWRPILEVEDTDKVELKADGKPYTMYGKPGRRSQDATDRMAQQRLKRQRELISKDTLYNLVKDNPDDPQVLHAMIVATLREAALLSHDREQAELENAEAKDVASISSRRLNALARANDLWVKRRQLTSSGSMSLDTPEFSGVFEYIVETISDVMEDSKLRPEQIDSVIQKFAKKVGTPEWKVEAKGRMIKAAGISDNG